MAQVRITAKRQATLPVALCEELGVKPGDNIQVERSVVGDEIVWVLRAKKPNWSWYGAARKYGQGKSHRWSEVDRSIRRGWAGDDRP